VSRTSAAVVLALVCTLAGSVSAQPEDAEAERTRLYQEAKQLVDAGRFDDAAVKLRRVIALRSAPKALIALAVVETELLHYLEASRLLERARSAARAGGLDADVTAAESQLADLEPLIPTIVVRGAEGVADLAIYVDDVRVEPGDGRVRADPGEHLVRLEAPLYQPVRRTIRLKPRDSVTLAVSMQRASSPSPSPPPREDDAPELAGPISLASVGAAAVIVGAVLMAVGTSDQDEASEGCGGGTTDCPENVRSLAAEGRDKIMAGNAVAGIGGALALGGAVWLIVELTGGAREDASALRFAPAPHGLRIAF
jgi:hypothetical protein